MKTAAVIVSAILGVIAVAFALSILLAFPVKWLWNATLPELFGFKEIGVWMAWKITFLCSILFKSHNFSSSN
jgi:hypothetical protein